MKELLLTTIEKVDRDSVENFSCLLKGYQDHDSKVYEDHVNVNHYFREQAFSDHMNHYIKTHVLLDPESTKIIGFFSILNEQVEISKKKKRSFKYKRYHIYRIEEVEVFPSVRVHQFALDREYHGHIHENEKYSEILMGHLFQTAKRVSSDSGCMFITLESTDNAIDFYESYGFTFLSKKNHLSLPVMMYRIADLSY